MTPDQFRTAGHVLVDWIADFRTTLEERSVAAQVAPGDVRRALPSVAPEHPGEVADLVLWLDDVVVPAMTHVQHPRYFGFFPANAALASVLGDLVSTGIGALGLTWESCPALTEVEEVVVAQMADLCGLDPTWRGVIYDTASVACLASLLCARERAFGFPAERGGMTDLDRPGCVYCSTEAHSSVRKAALLAGFGADHLRPIDLDPATRGLRPAHLAAAMAADVAHGFRPVAVVATVGTTATTGIDPVVDIVAVAGDHDAWVHVDAALAGSAMMLEECRYLFDGVDGADSLSWNPHKWMGTALDCSLFYVRDPTTLTRVMGTAPSYLTAAGPGHAAGTGDEEGAGDGAVPGDAGSSGAAAGSSEPARSSETAGRGETARSGEARGESATPTQLRDWGLPLGRRFRALKLWFHLHLDGAAAIRARLRRDLAHARRLADLVAATPEWEVLAPVPLQTVVVRHVPPELGPADGPTGIDETLDAHTLAWARAVNASGVAYLTPSIVDGRWAVRVSIGAEPTEWSDVVAVWEAMQQAVGEVPAGRLAGGSRDVS